MLTALKIVLVGGPERVAEAGVVPPAGGGRR